MRSCPALSFLLVVASLAAQEHEPTPSAPPAPPAPPAEGLFDGSTLRGWDGDPAIWSVRDGCIVGSTVAHRAAANTFLVWQGDDVADFVFECEVRLEGDNNSGVQYRARRQPAGPGGAFAVHGYQCDVHAEPAYFGMLYEEGGRGIVARHGERLALGGDGSRRVLGALHAPQRVDLAQWHRLRIVAKGRTLQHVVDGELAVEVVDEAPRFARSGVLALQVHAGAPMTVWFRSLRLVRLPTEEVAAVAPVATPAAATPAGATPQWIWDESPQDGEDVFFRRAFALDRVPGRAALAVTCDNRAFVHVNGVRVATAGEWTRPLVVDVTAHLRAGANVLAVHGTNEGGPAGLCAELACTDADGTTRTIVTGGDWRCSGDDPDGWDAAGFDDAPWPRATVLAPFGGGPWAASLPAGAFADLLVPPVPQPPEPAPELTLSGGLQAERLLRVSRVQGSWVCLAADSSGRLYASDQHGGLYRVHPAGLRGAATTTVERLDVALGGCQGLCVAFGSLFAVVNHGEDSGVWRLTDADGDDRLERVERLAALAGDGEHGPHAIVPDPDGRHLLVVCGNHTLLPPLARNRLPGIAAEDVLPRRIDDPNGHAVGIRAPGGFVCRFDPEQRTFELVCAGLRNAYDLAVLPTGDVLTFDADMEWDMGLPWYRPTRILHVVSGADYGWRSGSAKWPVHWADTLPAVADVGPGSPTGVVGYARGALALDWTFGTIWHVTPRPRGSSFAAEVREWASGAPFPVTDAVAAGGGLYVLTGGRGLPSSLYRIRVAGPPPEPPLDLVTGRDNRELRKTLEACHGVVAAGAIDAAWPHLGSADPFLRHAARVAVESQPVAQWRERALAPARATDARLTALLALARHGEAADLVPLVAALQALADAELGAPQRLALVRVAQLAVLRLAPRAGEAALQELAARLLPWFPSGDARLDRDVAALLARLDAPGFVARAVPLLEPMRPDAPPPWAAIAARNASYGGAIERMLGAMPPTSQLGIADALRGVANGWTIAQRRAFVAFLAAARQQRGGASYDGYLRAMVDAAWHGCSPAEQAELEALVGAARAERPAFRSRPSRGPGRDWQLAEASALARAGLRGRDFATGRNLFWAASCAACHRFAGEGGATGPDLTSLGGKFTADDVLRSILEPSAVVSDQYAGAVLERTDGTTLFGRVARTRRGDGDGGDGDGGDAGEVYEVVPATAAAVPVRVPAADVRRVTPSKQSPMPADLVDALAEDELLDLLAFLLSRGDANGPMFRR